MMAANHGDARAARRLARGGAQTRARGGAAAARAGAGVRAHRRGARGARGGRPASLSRPVSNRRATRIQVGQGCGRCSSGRRRLERLLPQDDPAAASAPRPLAADHRVRDRAVPGGGARGCSEPGGADGLGSRARPAGGLACASSARRRRAARAAGGGARRQRCAGARGAMHYAAGERRPGGAPDRQNGGRCMWTTNRVSVTLGHWHSEAAGAQDGRDRSSRADGAVG